MGRWALILVAALAVAHGLPAHAADPRFDRTPPEHLSELRLDEPLLADAAGFTDQTGRAGEQAVVVHLSGPSVAESAPAGGPWQAGLVAGIEQRQSRLVETLAGKYGAREIGRVQIVLNAVFLAVDSEAIPAIAREAGVARVAPVGEYRLDLTETVPAIGAADLRDAGLDGSGVTVAVLDSGIDYTHAAFGGAGTEAAYELAYGASPEDARNTTADGLFPTDKVIGGFDFVGEVWPDGPGEFGPDDLAFDPDPIDFGGHGTHVADIIAGANGVAPGASLYAVKVCSAVASSCNGMSLILGLEFAVDPNGDGRVDDRADIINMSLGSVYGQPFDDDLALAVDNASALGALTVASAGNSADKPYIVGTPAAAPTALAVAQTFVPAASVQVIDVVDPIEVGIGAVFQDWSAPLDQALGPAPVAYGGLGCSRGEDVNSVDPADAPYEDGRFAGQIVLVDRGECNFSVKIFNVQRAGAIAGIIGLVAPGEPFNGAQGAGGPYTIPAYMVGQVDALLLEGSTAIISPLSALPAVGNVVGSSSRGPSNGFQMVKPELAAPGASLSAVAGSGNGQEAFGGTSGAAPMVAGAAALLLQAQPDVSAGELKARLVNTGETEVGNSAFTAARAPITRVGGGEVRVNRAVNAAAAAWDDATGEGIVSYGMLEVSQPIAVTKSVRVRNYAPTVRTFSIAPVFRFEEDAAGGAVVFRAPASVQVGAGGDAVFEFTMEINPDALPANAMNSGSEGSNGAALTFNEFDGYLALDDGSAILRLPWHVLPRRAADLRPTADTFAAGAFPDVIGLTNAGSGTAQVDAYSLIALSPDLPEGARGSQSPTPDLRAFGVNTFPVEAGFCSAEPSFVWAFAITTWEEQSHLVPVSHIVELDVDRDGIVDFVVLNRDAAAGPPGFNQVDDGRQLTWVLGETTASAFFFAEHATNTANTVLYLCAEQIGFTQDDLLATQVDGRVTTQDFYFGGPLDTSDVFTLTPLGEQYLGSANDIPGNTTDPAGLAVFDFGPLPGNSQELGLLLYANGDRGPGARGGATDASDATVLSTAEPAITGFVLVDADTERDVPNQDPLVGGGAVIDLSVTPRFNIRAETTDRTVGSIAVEVLDQQGNPRHFRLDRRRWENFAPFAIGGDWPIGNYQPLALGPGTYTLRATPYSGGSLTGLPGSTRQVTFTVIDGR